MPATLRAHFPEVKKCDGRCARPAAGYFLPASECGVLTFYPPGNDSHRVAECSLSRSKRSIRPQVWLSARRPVFLAGMNDPLRSGYDAIPYRHGALRQSHPARMGAIGRLYGLPTAAPDRARVLELGCAEGGNLLPLAERLPRATFTGVDFSEVQIATAEAARAACGLANARMVCADLREWHPEAAACDYVIAHGVYSWVPDEVKECLLAACGRALAPGGMLYLSFNTLPGWGMLAGVREFLLAELAQFPGTAEKLAHLPRVLAALEQSLAGEETPHGVHMRELLGRMRAKSPEMILHDELELVNDPRPFSVVVAHAARHGLAYVGESHYASQHFEHLRPEMQAPLIGLGLDVLRVQQFMDVVLPRTHRTSLFCRASEAPPPRVDPSAVHACALALREPQTGPRADLAAGAVFTLRGLHGMELPFTQSRLKALLTVLIEAAPVQVPFLEARAAADARLAAAGLAIDVDDEALSLAVFRLFSLDFLDLLLAGDGAWLRPAEPPEPTALMRYQTEHGLPLTNRRHEQIALSAAQMHRLLAAPPERRDPALREAGLVG